MYDAQFIIICYAHVVVCFTQLHAIREGVIMRGVCNCDILRRASVKADIFLLRGFVRTLQTPPGNGHEYVYITIQKQHH